VVGNSALQEKLRQGIEAARKGDKIAAQKLLRQVTMEDSRNEVAWMWMASVSETLQERRACLEQAVRINPKNARAQEALNQLSAVMGEPRRTATGRQVRPAAYVSSRRSLPVGYTIVAVLVVLALLSAIIFNTVINSQPATPNPATEAALSAALLNTATSSPTVDPTDYTATPFFGVIVTVDNQATLPPSFTPTFTPTATSTPFPSATPFPVTLFTLVFTSQADNPQPMLYQSRGDATEQRQVGTGTAGFIDPIYDPTGERIAFVRNVTYTNDEGNEVTAPELFVAPINNLDAARQLTQLGGTSMSRPTFAPDGIQIVFVSNVTGNDDLWYITEDGNNARPLTNDPGIDKDPAWSPNGDVILFASERAAQPGTGLTEIFSITPDGETVVQLTDAQGSSYSPAWSPTGERVVFLSDRSGDSDVYIMTADGQLPFLLTVDDQQAEDRSPVFTPNGQNVAFLSNRVAETFALYMVDLTGRTLTRLSEVPPDIESLSFLPFPLIN
jgi:hypothetical protein